MEGYFLGEVQDNEGTLEFKYYPEKLLTTDASLSSDELTLIESLAAGNNPGATSVGSVSFTPLPSYSGNIEVSTFPFHNTYLLSSEEGQNFDPNNLTIQNGTFVGLVTNTHTVNSTSGSSDGTDMGSDHGSYMGSDHGSYMGTAHG